MLLKVIWYHQKYQSTLDTVIETLEAKSGLGKRSRGLDHIVVFQSFFPTFLSTFYFFTALITRRGREAVDQIQTSFQVLREQISWIQHSIMITDMNKRITITLHEENVEDPKSQRELYVKKPMENR